jgi:hypothetical protein
MNGGLGFSFLPVIQVAGAQRIIESDPRQLFSSGNFTIVPTMYVLYLFMSSLHDAREHFLLGLVQISRRAP